VAASPHTPLDFLETVEIDQQEMHRLSFVAGRRDGLVPFTREAKTVRERGERVSLGEEKPSGAKRPARGCGPARAFRVPAQAP